MVFMMQFIKVSALQEPPETEVIFFLFFLFLLFTILSL